MEIAYSPAAAAELFQPIRRIYLFFGEDDRQKDDALSLLQTKAVDPDFVDFDLEQMDADSGADRILSAASMAPFASTVRLVVVRRAEIFRKREMAAEAERLAKGIAGLGAGSCLVLRAGAGEDEGARGKTALHPKIDAAVKETGAVVRFKALGEEQLVDWVIREAESSGKRISDSAAQLLVQLAGGNRTVLRNELEKTICFAGDAVAIDSPMVEAILSHDPQDVTFKLVDAVSRRNADRALHLFAELLRYETKPHSIAGRLLALLARQYSLLWQARELAGRGVVPQKLKNIPPELAEQLPADGSILTLSWKAGELFQMARSWNSASLAQAMEHLAQCDVDNKGGGEGSEDVRRNLEILIVNLCGLR